MCVEKRKDELKPSNVNAGYRVPTSTATVTSVDADEGALNFPHRTEVADVHAAVPHATPSMRLLGVASLCPKLSPEMDTTPTSERALLSTPR